MRRRHVPSSARPLRLVATLIVSTLLVGFAGAGAAWSFGRAIEPIGSYQPQRTCSPTAKLGTRKLADYLITTYRGTGSSGIVRACSSGGQSEHKEGRAFDWRVDYNKPAQRKQAEDFLRKLTATDSYGNELALARRMGVMYVIWNRRIFSMNDGAWKPYTGASAHRDHVHISLTWAGANGTTSFYSGRVLPAPKPTPAPVPSAPKPRPLPKPAPPLPPVLDQQRIPDAVSAVPATGAPVRTSHSLKAGTTYRVVATGTYGYGTQSSQVADASCAWSPYDDDGWRSASEVRLPALTVTDADGRASSTWRSRTGGRCELGTHTYVLDLRPSRTGPVTFRLPASGTGKLTVHVMRAGADAATVGRPVATLPPPAAPTPRTDGFALLDESLTLPAAGTTGVWTDGVLTAGVPYEIEARGSYDDGAGQADAECSRRRDSQEWRRHGSIDPYAPGEDRLDLYVDGQDPSGKAVDDNGEGCDENSTYRWRYTPAATSRAQFAIWDRTPADNRGELELRVRRMTLPGAPQPGATLTDGRALVNERIVLPAGATATTAGVLQKGTTYAVRVTGRYSYGAGLADAECATAPGETSADADWRRSAGDYPGLNGRDLFDLYLDGRDLELRTQAGSWDGCDPDGTYVTYFRAKRTTRVALALWTLEPRDARGSVTVTLTRA